MPLGVALDSLQAVAKVVKLGVAVREAVGRRSTERDAAHLADDDRDEGVRRKLVLRSKVLQSRGQPNKVVSNERETGWQTEETHCVQLPKHGSAETLVANVASLGRDDVGRVERDPLPLGSAVREKLPASTLHGRSPSAKAARYARVVRPSGAAAKILTNGGALLGERAVVEHALHVGEKGQPRPEGESGPVISRDSRPPRSPPRRREKAGRCRRSSAQSSGRRAACLRNGRERRVSERR